MRCYKIEDEALALAEQALGEGLVCVCSQEEANALGVEPDPWSGSSKSARLEAYEGYDYIWMNLVDQIAPRFSGRVGLYLTPGRLVFICEGSCSLIESVISSFQNGRYAHLTVMRVAYAFFSGLTADDAEHLEAMEEEIAAIEERVIGGESGDFVREIVALRKSLMFYKRYYDQLLDVAENLEENENGLLSKPALRAFRMFTGRVERLNRNVQELREYVSQVLEAYQSQVDINLNKVMKLFTVVTAVCLPLTLIAGWYGMNFENMPELHWQYGYFYAIAVALIFVIGCFVYFKKKKIL